MVGIYKFITIQGEIYVGYSTNINKRMKFHSYKHEIDTFEVLEECEKSQLLQREQHWIKHYDSYNNGLNSNKGGGGTITHTTETKELISNARKGWKPSIARGLQIGMKLKGTHHSKETKNKISESNKGISRGKGRTSPNKGNKYNEEARKKISIGRKGIVFSQEQKNLMSKNQWKIRKINQLDLDGNFIQQWNSITSAKSHIGGDINSCLRKKQKTAGGFKWEYVY